MATGVFVGDMNATGLQIEKVLAAGFIDSWEEAGAGPGYTANAANPEHRIDWIPDNPDSCP